MLRIFGPKVDEVAREWRKLHKDTLNDLFSSPIMIVVIKLRRKGWAGRETRVGEMIGAYRILMGNLRERDHLENTGIDRTIILGWILRGWTGLIWLRVVTGGRDL